jgi:hypothetical protein
MRWNSRPRARAIERPSEVFPVPGGPNPLLDLLETVVVLVEDRAGRLDVQAVLRDLRPRQLHHPFEIASDHAVFGGGGRHLGQPLQLPAGLLLRLLGHSGRGDPLPKPLHLGLVVAPLAELLPDRLELLAQHVVALGLADVALDLLADLRLVVHAAE